MLDVRLSRDDGYAHIGYRRAGQNSDVHLFLKMGQYQALPVDVQVVLAAVCRKVKPCSALGWFKQQMNLGVVPKRFVMTNTLHRSLNGFLVRNAALVEYDIKPETLFYQGFQHLKLNLSHELNVYFLKLLVPDDTQHRIFVAKSVELRKRGRDIGFRRERHAIGKHGFKQGSLTVALGSQTFSGSACGQTGHGAESSRSSLVNGCELRAGVNAYLIDLFLFSAAVKQSSDLQRAAGYLHVSKPRPLIVGGYFINKRAEFSGLFRLKREFVNSPEQGFHAFQLQRRAVHYRKHFPPEYCRGNKLLRYASGLQK